MATLDWNARVTAYLQKTGVPTGGASDTIAMIGSGCQAAAERLIGRTLETRDYVEAYTGTGKAVLFLQHDPIVKLSAVNLYGNDLTVADPNAAPVYPPAEVAVNRTADGLIRTSGSVWPDWMVNSILVTYSAGLSDYATKAPPDDLVFGITLWAAQLFRRRDRLGESSSSFAGQMTSFVPEDVPAVSRTIFERYRRAFLPC
jgi:hypothetical protein